jgi:hypothetical protein
LEGRGLFSLRFVGIVGKVEFVEVSIEVNVLGPAVFVLEQFLLEVRVVVEKTTDFLYLQHLF